MSNCPKCGNPMQDGVDVCSICGTNIKSVLAADSVPVVDSQGAVAEQPVESTPVEAVKPIEVVSDPVAVESAPAPVEAVTPTVVEATPVQSAPVEATPVAATPVEVAQPAPVEAAPAVVEQPAQVEPVQATPTVVEATPVAAEQPVQQAEVAVAQPEVTTPATVSEVVPTVDSGAVQEPVPATVVEATPQPVSVEATPVEVQATPVEAAPVAATPVEVAQPAPVEAAPAVVEQPVVAQAETTVQAAPVEAPAPVIEPTIIQPTAAPAEAPAQNIVLEPTTEPELSDSPIPTSIGPVVEEAPDSGTPIPSIPASLNTPVVETTVKVEEKKKKGLKINKKVLYAAIAAIVVMTGVAIFLNKGGGAMGVAPNIQQPGNVALLTTEMDGYSFNVQNGWKVGKSDDKVLISNNDDSVVLSLSYRTGQVGTYDAEAMKLNILADTRFSEVTFKNEKIEDRDALIFESKYNNYFVQFYYVNNTTETTVDAAVVYQSTELKDKLESDVRALIATLKFNVKASRSIDLYNHYNDEFEMLESIFDDESEDDEDEEEDEEDDDNSEDEE
ncbi:MAG: hypothetical protein IKQ29_02510 [Bacilli bacterium]|nr:hypothetical protein [Bacilli bacterium]